MASGWRETRDKLSRRWFYALFCLLPLTAVFGHRGVAPWLLLASFPAFARGDFWQAAFGKLFDNPSLSDPRFAGFAALLFLCFWIFLSSFWSPKHQYDLFLFVLETALVGASIVWFSLNLTREWAWRLGRAFCLAIAGGMIILSFEGVTDGFLRSALPPREPSLDRDMIALGRGVTALVPALFPAAAIAARLWSRTAALFIFALGIAAAVSNDVLANVAALAAGSVAVLIALAAPRAALRAVGWVAIALLLAAPFLAAAIPVEAIYDRAQTAPPETLSAAASSLHRLAIWRATGMEALSCLPFGCGADYARIWNDTAPMVMVPGIAAPVSVIPIHPHNVFLQIWLELGLPGVAATALFLYFCLTSLTRAALSKTVSAAAAGAFVAAMAASVMIEGSLWQVWRFAAMALAASGVALAHSLEKR